MYYYEEAGAVTGVIIVIAIVICIIGAVIMAGAADKKGYQEEKAKIIVCCIFLGIVGWLYVVALPDKNAAKQREQLIRALQESGKTDASIASNISAELPEI